jgi:hypothetical protein
MIHALGDVLQFLGFFVEFASVFAVLKIPFPLITIVTSSFLVITFVLTFFVRSLAYEFSVLLSLFTIVLAYVQINV